MSGRLLEDIKPLVKPNEKLKSLRVFISHGTNDNVLGINYAREAKDYIEKQGIKPVYKEYQDVHTINNSMLTDLIQWLKKK